MIDRVERAYLGLVRREDVPDRVRRALTFLGAFTRASLEDQIPIRAATLAFWSLMALVPLLVVVAAALQPFGGTEGIRALLYSTFLAGPVRAVGTQLDAWLAQVDLAKLGVAGLVGVLLTASRIYTAVEEAYNTLWGCTVRRSWLARMVTFYALLTLVPVLVAYGFHLSSAVPVAVDVGVMRRIAPVLATAVAFSAAIRALPDTRVRWWAAVVGGACSAGVFELAKALFGAYTGLLGGADAAAVVYGSVALFPVFLLWLYVSWVIVLLGVELAYVAQHLPALSLAERRIHEGLPSHARHPDAFFALQCLAVVVRGWATGAGAVDGMAVTRALETEPSQVHAAMVGLARAGLLVETPDGFVPAGPPSQVTVREAFLRYRALVRPVGASSDGPSDLPARLLGDAADRDLAAFAAAAD